MGKKKDAYESQSIFLSLPSHSSVRNSSSTSPVSSVRTEIS